MQMPILKMRSDVHVRPQVFGKQLRYVIEDPVNAKFYRIGIREYLLASAMDGVRTIEKAVSFAKASAPEQKWNEEHIGKTIRWLVSSGLLRSEDPKRASANSSPSSNFRFDPFFFRLPLVPGAMLESVARRFTWVFSPIVGIAALLVVSIALGFLITDIHKFTAFSSQLFVPDRWLFWLVAWLLLKTLHELGHSIACVGMGGSIRSAGIGMMFMMPVPFVDMTDGWRLSNRFARFFCSIAGILVEVAVAGVAVIICYLSDTEAIQFTCAAIATLGTISTLAFNANPLARFDGYFAVSDWLDHPNLWSDGQAHFSRLLKRPVTVLADPSQRALALYGGLCLLYRCSVVIGFAIATIATWHGIGVLVVLLAAYLWYFVPMQRARIIEKLKVKSAREPIKLRRFVAYFCIAFATGILCFLPSPFQPVSPGYVSYVDPVTIRNESAGFIAEIYANDGDVLEKGQPIARLENPALALERDRRAVALAMSEGRCRILRAQGKLAELQAEEANIRSNSEQLDVLEQKMQMLTICAPMSGCFHSRTLHNQRGRFLSVGTVFGMMAEKDHFEVRGSIAQSDVDRTRLRTGEDVWVMIEGRGTIKGRMSAVLPRGSDELENPTLAAIYGGPIPVKLVAGEKNKEKLTTKSSRFTVRIRIDDANDQKLHSGQICRIRLANQSESVISILDKMRIALWDWLKKDARDIDGNTI